MQTVELNAQVFGDPANPALIILHGLFGSSRNWSQLAGMFSEQYHVHALDLRNHGVSPHFPQLDYPAMSADVLYYMDMHRIRLSTMLGHSMGGKVAMWLALTAPNRVQNLIIIDIAPVTYSNDFARIFEGLKRIPLSEIESRKQADSYLSEYVDELPVRQFLLQNLINQSGCYRWRIPIAYIEDAILHINGFPETSQVNPCHRPTLFIGGKQSGYLSSDSHQVIHALFPFHSIEMLENAGHWLHAEQPDKVLELVRRFAANTLQTFSEESSGRF